MSTLKNPWFWLLLLALAGLALVVWRAMRPRPGNIGVQVSGPPSAGSPAQTIQSITGALNAAGGLFSTVTSIFGSKDDEE